MSTLSLVTPPTEEPIDLDTAKSQCRVDLSDDDALIQSYIVASREYVENYTGRQLMTATWDLVLDGFCDLIDIPKAPLQSITSVGYLDTSGIAQTLLTANYVVSRPAGPTASRGRITRAFSTWWPITRYQADTVTIRFVAGYGNASQVPTALKQAMLLLISHWYRNREPVMIDSRIEVLPMAVDALLGPYRTWPVSLC